ncbi:hybrid-cluster NAD(P)-dependent oxidoreductase [Ornithinicoccus hortensis]|uniref:Ferredoxin-NADP reductase n=2 Tax=Ornithinicoccus hortensis TaxID=82346 RepID=A0A542YTJ6_9MICO|nr:ferredoxin-NADP reductase [Ornithinicoccus hortensis]
MTDMLTRTPGTTSPEWVEEFAGVLTCTAVTDITHDVRSFSFALPGGAGLLFHPGQYLTLQLDLDGGTVERCYTISSSPALSAGPTITVKRVPGGPVSNWLHDHLRPGDVLRASGPLGVFSTAHHPSRRYLLLSAGSGITPLMSMVRDLRDRADGADVVFVHCARTPADIIFRTELAELAASGVAAVHILCEEDSPTETWEGPRGRLTLPALFGAAPDLLEREVFSCGPPPFMAAVREHLTLVAADPARCHEESFVLGTAGAPPAPGATPSGPGDPSLGSGTAPTTYTVEFLRSGRVLECDEHTTVLSAAAAAGMSLPSSCTEGLCGTCKSTLVSGEVDMQHQGGIRAREVALGKFLPCCSRPRSDLQVDA